MHLKKTLATILMLGLGGTASAEFRAVPAIQINGLPLVFNHPAEPGHGTTQMINLSQLGNFSSVWNVVCEYQVKDSVSGQQMPVSILGIANVWGNYLPQMYVDGQYVGPADVINHPAQTTLNSASGTITFTNIYAYEYNPIPTIAITNIDDKGDFTIKRCEATFIPN